EQDGFQRCVIATDTDFSISLVASRAPDVVLLDVHMPRINGLEILRLLRAEVSTSHIPIVILTASVDRETRLQALQGGASEVLCKPVDRTELLLSVRNVVAVKRYEDQLKAHAANLDAQVRQRTADLEKRTRQLEASRMELIFCLARAAEFRDNDLGR